MRLAPLFVALATSAWAFLAASAWAVGSIALHRDPRFTTLGLGLLGGAIGVAACAVIGQRSGLALALSFPAAFLASLAACAADYRLRRSGHGASLVRADCQGYHEATPAREDMQ